jgi:hypothetical protein
MIVEAREGTFSMPVVAVKILLQKLLAATQHAHNKSATALAAHHLRFSNDYVVSRKRLAKLAVCGSRTARYVCTRACQANPC